MQPPRPKSRQIGSELRTDPPLVYDRLSDPILVRRAKDGDARALAALCERHAPRVERLALHLLDDAEDTRDASQEALAKLCVRLPQFRGEARFTTWLHRLTVNTCRDVAARQRIRRQPRRGRAVGSPSAPRTWGASRATGGSSSKAVQPTRKRSAVTQRVKRLQSAIRRASPSGFCRSTYIDFCFAKSRKPPAKAIASSTVCRLNPA